MSAHTAAERKQEEIRAAREAAMTSKRDYSSVWGSTYSRYQNELILAYLPSAQSTVLDCGCGVGVLLKDLVTRCSCVHGLDISEKSLELIECSHPALRSLVVGDAEQMPYKGGVFDAVVLRGTLHHLADLAGGMQEFKRVLKPGGVLVVAEPCSDFPIIFWGRKLLSKRREKSFDTRELRSLFSTTGYWLIGERRFGYIGYAVTYLLRRSLADLGRPAWLWRNVIRLLIGVDEMVGRIPAMTRLNVGMIMVGVARE